MSDHAADRRTLCVLTLVGNVITARGHTSASAWPTRLPLVPIRAHLCLDTGLVSSRSAATDSTLALCTSGIHCKSCPHDGPSHSISPDALVGLKAPVISQIPPKRPGTGSSTST